MSALVRGFTPNYSFKLINFDTPRWHTLEYSNWQLIDALLAESGIPSVRGEWANSTQYLAGERVFDSDNGFIYRAIPDIHTSSDTGTFAEERTNHPEFWQLQSLDVPFYRGAWNSSTVYSVGDIINDGEVDFYLCIKTHTSGVAFEQLDRWQLVFSTQGAIDTIAGIVADAETAIDGSIAAAAASATAAAGSATAAAGSATAAATSATNAATSATNAANQVTLAAAQVTLATTQANNSAASASASATSATNSANSATTATTQAGIATTQAGNAATSATNSATSATNSSNSASASAASAVDAANAAAGLRATSTSSVAIGTGSKTFTTQAGKQFITGHFVTIVDAAAPTTNWMTGQVTSYSGTTLQVNVSGINGGGTLANWQIGVAGQPGAAGVIGLSSVDPAHLNADTGPEQLLFRDRLNLVSRAGDTMTGDLTINNTIANININATTASQQAFINFFQSGVTKWQFGKNTDQSFLLWDSASSTSALIVASGGTASTSSVQVLYTTPSTSTSTGALRVSGGVGIVGALYVGGTINGVGASLTAGITLNAAGTVGFLKGGAVGNSTTPDRAAMNFTFYDGGATNYAGISATTGGDVFIVTGTSGTPATRLLITAAGAVSVSGTFTGSNSTNAFGPGGATAANSTVQINSGSTGVAYLSFRRNSVEKYQLGVSVGAGGANEGLNLYSVGTATTIASFDFTTGVFALTSTSAASSTTTGALRVAGGLGVAGAAYVGGDITIQRTTTAILNINTSTGTVAIQFRPNNTLDAWIRVTDHVDFFSNAGGSAGVQMAFGGNSWAAVSDERLSYKRNAIDISDKLPSLADLLLYEGDNNGRKEIFFKAQQLNRLFPQVVEAGDDDPDYVPTGLIDPRAWKMTYDRIGAISLAYARQHDARLRRLEDAMGIH